VRFPSRLGRTFAADPRVRREPGLNFARGHHAGQRFAFRYVNDVRGELQLGTACEDIRAKGVFRLRSELVKQRLCCFEIGGVKTLGKTVKDRREQLARLLTSTLAAPHPREVGRGAEFPRQGALPTRRVQGLPEVILRRCGRIGSVLQQNKLALDAQQFGDAPTLSAALRSLKRLVDSREPLSYLPGAGQTLR
jgi:hypothetical protein